MSVDDKGVYGDVNLGLQRAQPVDRAGRAFGIAVLAAVLVLASVGVAWATASAHSFFPKAWDPQIAPIAAKVATLRGLDFEHPVQIRYLDAKAFEKQLGADEGNDATQTAENTRDEAVFRALGFIGGKVDLAKEVQTASSSSTLAFYDPNSQEVFVRGTTLDVAHRVTLAHELTHVLQDQHFDLGKLQKRADDAPGVDGSGLKALIEGDAERISQDYLKQLPAADRHAYDKEDAAEGARVDKETAGVPDIVTDLFSAPYALGPDSVRVISQTGGNAAVDAALTGPPASSAVFVAAGDISPPVVVTPPALPAGGVAVGDPEVFGPFETLLTLSMRLDVEKALTAADVVAGGEAVTFRSKGETCYRVALQPKFARSRAYLLSSFQSWADGRARSSVDAVGDLVQFTACDPGRTAPVPSGKPLQSAMTLLEIRTGVTVGAASKEISGRAARCLARVFLQQAGAEQLVLAIGNGSPTAQQTTQIQRLIAPGVIACHSDPDTGLP